MSEEVSTRNVTKFDGSNFLTWKFEVTQVLVSLGIQDIVTGERIIPGDDLASATSRKTWIKDNAKAMFVICSSMETKQKHPMITCTSARAMWEKLSQIHEQKSVANKLILTQRFHEYKMDSSESIVSHVAKIEHLAQQLKDIGQHVDDVMIMAKILGSLPSKYNALRTAWDSVPESKQTVDTLLERLIKEETNLTKEDDATTSALAAISTKKNADKTKNKQQQDRKKKYFECYFCKKPGHIARYCRQRMKGEKFQGKTENQSGHFAMLVQEEPTDGLKDVWLADSGASKHITYRRDWFVDFQATSGDVIRLGDNGLCNIDGIGTIKVEAFGNGKWNSVTLHNVLYVPKIKKNLFSVGAVTALGYTLTFKDEHVLVSKDRKTVVCGLRQSNGICRMFIRMPNKTIPEVNYSGSDLQRWHERLGHINVKELCHMVKSGMINDIKLNEANDFFCEACHLGKSVRMPKRHSSNEKTYKAGEFIHSDVCGPMSMNSIAGSRFFVTFIDEFSNYRTVYFLKHKSDVFDRFVQFVKHVENKFDSKVKVLHSDNGKEYCNQLMRGFLSQKGIAHETTAPYAPEQNGKAERENRTIIEAARTMLVSKNLPTYLWAEAVNTAIHVLNRTTSKRTPEVTPYELWNKRKPIINHFKIFGTAGYVNIPALHRKKFQPNAKKVIMVGYQEDSTNYRIFDPEKRVISLARDVVFDEQCAVSATSRTTSENGGLLLPKASPDDLNKADIFEEDSEYEDSQEEAEEQPPDEHGSKPEIAVQQPVCTVQNQGGEARKQPTNRKVDVQIGRAHV